MFKNSKKELLIEELSSINIIFQSMIGTKLELKNIFNENEVMSQKSRENEENIGSKVNKKKKTIGKTDEYFISF